MRAARTGAAILLAPVLLFAAGVAQAQQWPQRAVRILVPFAAGGNTDTIARVTAERLSQVFSQQFVVENRIGAGGAIAAEAVARAAPDGHTLFVCPSSQMSVVPLMQKVSYDPRGDFAPRGDKPAGRPAGKFAGKPGGRPAGKFGGGKPGGRPGGKPGGAGPRGPRTPR